MTISTPTAETRWRCTLCGNLTRFDVTRSARVVEYLHFDLGGESKVEETEVLSETLESVRCRWCNAVDQVELVPRPGAEAEAAAQAEAAAGSEDGAGPQA